MKRIGILTFHRARNYGSVLQAHALSFWVNNHGHQAEVVNFSTTAQKELYALAPNGGRGFKKIAQRLFFRFYRKKLVMREKAFDAFLLNKMALSKEQFDEKSNLKALNQLFDCFITGSDQVWNASCTDFHPAYLLDFANESATRIAYAPSFGLQGPPDTPSPLFASQIRKFAYVSTREPQSKGFLASLYGGEVKVVPDPVFLLPQDYWQTLAVDRIIKEEYVLCYFIGPVPEMRKRAKKAAKSLGKKIVVINPSIRDAFYTKRKFYSAGPQEFLSLIAHASCIFTDSFHAVAFSLIFRKDFFVWIKSNSKGESDPRICNLLKRFDLFSRAVNLSSSIDLRAAPIDYTLLESSLTDFSNTGVSFLIEALAGRNS